jgi:hypothetical protein
MQQIYKKLNITMALSTVQTDGTTEWYN